VGLFRKTMSLSTLGLVSFRNGDDRSTRIAKQTRNAARAQVAQQAMALEHQRQLIAHAEYAAAQREAQAWQQQQMLFQQMQAQQRHPQHVQGWAPAPNPVPPQPLPPGQTAAQAIPAAPPVARPAPTTPPPGWYPDQQNARLVRWFDGMRWTEHTQPRS
jgi:hypothetical protein